MWSRFEIQSKSETCRVVSSCHLCVFHHRHHCDQLQWQHRKWERCWVTGFFSCCTHSTSIIYSLFFLVDTHEWCVREISSVARDFKRLLLSFSIFNWIWKETRKVAFFSHCFALFSQSHHAEVSSAASPATVIYACMSEVLECIRSRLHGSQRNSTLWTDWHWMSRERKKWWNKLQASCWLTSLCENFSVSPSFDGVVVEMTRHWRIDYVTRVAGVNTCAAHCNRVEASSNSFRGREINHLN